MSANDALDGVCVVCFKPIEIYSIGDCDHPVCFECSTRMRVLCLQTECPICRHDISKVIFTSKVEPYKAVLSKLINKKGHYEDKYKILFADFVMKEAYLKLLEHHCRKCGTTFKTFTHLKDHMSREHDFFFCDLCVDNLKIFTNERKFYTRQQLAFHRRKGDPDDTSHRGHPLCEFCDTRYMDTDELFRHLRKDHLYCHICDADGFHQYYVSFDTLRDHFRRDHYLCEEGDCCSGGNMRVFRTEVEYKAHKTSEHGRGLSKQAARQARTLEVQFTLTPRPMPIRVHRVERDEGDNTRVENIRDMANHMPQAIESTPVVDTGSIKHFPTLGDSSTGSVLNLPLGRHDKPIIRQTSGALARTDENFPALSDALPGVGPSTSFRLNISHPGPSTAVIRTNVKPNVCIQVHNQHQSQPSSSRQGVLNEETNQKLLEEFPCLSKKDKNLLINDYTSYAASNTTSTKKGKSRSKQFSPEQCMSLLDLLDQNRAITSKQTDAVTNVAKEQAWKKVKMRYNATNLYPRDITQLKLKWDIFKKTIRKRAALIASNVKVPGNQVNSVSNKGNVVSQVTSNKAPPPPTLDAFPALQPSGPGPATMTPVQPQWIAKVKTKESIPKQKLGGGSQQPCQPPKPLLNDYSQFPAPPPASGSLPWTNKRKDKSPNVNTPDVAQLQPQWVGPKQKDSTPKVNKVAPAPDIPTQPLNISDFPTLKSKQKRRQLREVVTDINDNSVNVSKKKDKSKNSNLQSIQNPLSDVSKSKPSNKENEKSSRNMKKKNNNNSSQISFEKHSTNTLQENDTVNIATGSEGNNKINGSHLSSNDSCFVKSKPFPDFSPRNSNLKNNSQTASPLCNGFTFTNSSGEDYKIPAHNYVQPINFNERNKSLVSKFMEVLGEADAIHQFKLYSQLFREGRYSAECYYNHCIESMKHAFNDIFPELLALLPDIRKQQELHKVHLASNRLPLHVCQICGQILIPADVQFHRDFHTMQSAFPALGPPPSSVGASKQK